MVRLGLQKQSTSWIRASAAVQLGMEHPGYRVVEWRSFKADKTHFFHRLSQPTRTPPPLSKFIVDRLRQVDCRELLGVPQFVISSFHHRLKFT